MDNLNEKDSKEVKPVVAKEETAETKVVQPAPQQNDSQKRMEEFKSVLMEASKRLECDFVVYPQFLPKDDGSFAIIAGMQIVDRTKAPQKSPISKEELFDK